MAIDLRLGDCLLAMRKMKDKQFDLAIIDPPYGGGGFDKHKVCRTGGTWNKKYYEKGTNHTKTTNWDIAPEESFFKELFRVSEYQIIWGGNYFKLSPSRNFIIWRKLTISENFTMAMAEYAWTNIPGNAKVFECVPQDPARFHPTQKPIKLYKWLLKNYAKPGDKILDTHLGSGSIAIACYDMGFDLAGYEIDKEYYDGAVARLEQHKKQQVMEF